MKITICGSLGQRETILKVKKFYEEKGNEVMTPFTGRDANDEDIIKIRCQFLAKMRWADMIVFIPKKSDSYESKGIAARRSLFGESTSYEYSIALSMGKMIAIVESPMFEWKEDGNDIGRYVKPGVEPHGVSGESKETSGPSVALHGASEQQPGVQYSGVYSWKDEFNKVVNSCCEEQDKAQQEVIKDLQSKLISPDMLKKIEEAYEHAFEK